MESTIDQLKYQKVIDFLKTKPVKKAYLFGSHARGEANKDSDIDLLIELSYPIGLGFIRLKLDLEDLLGMSVDLIAEGSVSKHIKPYIDKDKLLIYEKK